MKCGRGNLLQVTGLSITLDWPGAIRKDDVGVNLGRVGTNPMLYPPTGTIHPMKIFSLPLAGAVAAAFLALTGCSKHDDVLPSIASIAVGNPDFQELEDAAVRGDVAVLLSNKAADGSDYTVFAPTNAAFARLGLNTAADLAALDRGFLRNTLFYHVTGGRVAGTALTAGSATASALGATVTRRIIVRGADKYVNGSKILATDVQAANGVVHPIDKVLLHGGGNIVETAVALTQGKVFVQPELTFLVRAVLRCNLQGALASAGPFTVFAPTDKAFNDFGITTFAQLDAVPVADLTAILKGHVLAGPLGNKFTPELPDGTDVTTLSGSLLTLGAFANGKMMVEGTSNAMPANMVIPDVQCTNGVVHVIDKILY
jgi:uncharacterized surface protein with fasciclin (FAS1) repeats